MSVKLNKVLLLNTEVTKNNRRYTKEVLESIRDQINSEDSSRQIGTMGFPEGLEINLRDAAFTYSNAVVEGDCLYVDISPLKTTMGDELVRRLELDSQFSTSSVRFRPGGMATNQGVPVEVKNTLNVPDVVNSDYKIISVAAIDESEDALNIPTDETDWENVQNY
jgi:hypothetical protein